MKYSIYLKVVNGKIKKLCKWSGRYRTISYEHLHEYFENSNLYEIINNGGKYEAHI